MIAQDFSEQNLVGNNFNGQDLNGSTFFETRLDGGDFLSFRGIAALDVHIVSGSAQFRIGDGIAGNAGFATGELLLTLSNTGFNATDAINNIDAENRPIVRFS